MEHISEIPFMVIAIYSDDHQRFADTYPAKSADEAEALALEEHPNLIIAGVINTINCQVEG